MAKSEQDKIVDAWVAERNGRIGEIRVPQLGEYPPDLHNFYGSQLNEWVTTDLIRHYADAIGDRNPLWRSEEYARKTSWGGIIAPPTFTNSILHNAPFNFEPEKLRRFKAWHFLPFGSRREWFQPMRPGDRLRVVQRYIGIKEVETEYPKPAREFYETVRRTIINQRDEPVAAVDSHFRLVINHIVDAEHTFWLARKKHRLTDEERDAIYRGYDEEKRRGADTLFWEDVVAGEEIKLHPIGPLAVWDVAAFFTAEPGHCVGFEVEWERIKLFPEWHWLDPEVNAWTCSGVCHFCDGKGHASVFTGGTAVGTNSQLDGLIGRMICNWMGDNGFVRVFDTRNFTSPIIGEVFYTKGQVTNKSAEGGEYLVDLEVRCENRDGISLTSGSARVKLPSRTDLKV